MHPDECDIQPWSGASPPSRVLAVRLQALGDVSICLPWLAGLKQAHPGLHLDFLTKAEYAAIPEALGIFNRVFRVKGGINDALNRAHAFLVGMTRLGQYDAVLDLQHNHISRWIRNKVSPSAWSEFDRFAAKPAGERYGDAVKASGLGSGEPCWVSGGEPGPALRREVGEHFVVLNPAGLWPTRNWPIPRYAEFAAQWQASHPGVKFVVMGLEDRVGEKAQELSDLIGGDLVNLVGRTSVRDAFQLLGAAALVVSEDSGLMHMAWIQNTPVVGLFGSTNSIWAKPCSPNSAAFTSEDLSCACCMKPDCERGDIHCLDRVTADMVMERAEAVTA